MSRQVEVEKEFPASALGQRVGWTEVHEGSHDGVDHVGVNVAVATVSGQRAQFGHEILTNPNRQKSLPFPFAHGFSAVTVFSGFFRKKHDRGFESELAYTPEGDRGFVATRELLANGSLGFHLTQDGAERVWSDGSAQLLDTLKQQLSDAGFAPRYDDMYLWINGTVARDSRGDVVTLGGHDERELLMPDASQRELTAEQIAHLRAMIELYDKAIANDETMSRRLTVSSDIPARDIPGEFVASRQQATAHEYAITARADMLTVRRLGFAPSGHGPHGRTWPYMDAIGRDLHAQYQRELDAIQAGDVTIASYELGREVGELHGRRALAAVTLKRFELLHELEQA